MSETLDQREPTDAAESAGAEHSADPPAIRSARRKGRARRIALIAVASLVAVVLREPVSSQLWKAIRNDAVAAFARQHPAAVTAAAPF